MNTKAKTMKAHAGSFKTARARQALNLPNLKPLILFIALGCSVSQSFGTQRLWSGAGANNSWTTTTNWVGGVVPNNAANGAVFYSGTPTFFNPSVLGTAAPAYVDFNASADANVTITLGNGTGTHQLVLRSTTSSGPFPLNVAGINVDAGAAGNHTISSFLAPNVNERISLGIAGDSGAFTYQFRNNSANTLNLNTFIGYTQGTANPTRNMQFDGAGNIFVAGGIVPGGTGNATGNLLKEGTGTLTLAGANTYTGTTTVTAGTLIVTGTHTAGGAYSVGVNGTLGGTGTIGSATTVAGSLRPGTVGIGTLTVSNDVTWDGGTDWVFQLGASNTSDRLNITTTASEFLRGTGSTFRFDFAGSTSLGNFTLVDWASTASVGGGAPGTSFNIGNFTYTNLGAGNTGTFAFDGTSLVFTAIPEPSAWALLAATMTAFVVFRRRRVA